jgi:hypothetical protein
MDREVGVRFSPFYFTVYSNRTVERCKWLSDFEEMLTRLREFEEI